MAKVDFSILFDTIDDDVRDVKDIALVSDIANVSQQIKNVLLSNKIERPFNPTIGVDMDVMLLASTTLFEKALYKSRMKAALEYSIPNITDVKVSFGPGAANQTLINVKYKYLTKPQSILGSLNLTINNT